MTRSKFKERKPITSWIKDNTGSSLSYVAEQGEKLIGKKVSTTAMYNFTKGVTRNPDVERLLLKFGVPQSVIDKTFEIDEEENQVVS